MCSGTTAEWSSCTTGLTNPFLGCCSGNACANETGCSINDLVAARLPSNSSQAAVFKTATTQTIASATPAATTSQANPTMTTLLPTNTTAAQSNTPKPSTVPEIAIGVGCGVFAFAALGVLMPFVIRRLSTARRLTQTSSGTGHRSGS